MICKKNGHDKSGLYEGRMYVRPLGKVESAAVQSQTELRDIIDRAVDKRFRKDLEAMKRRGILGLVGAPPAPSDDDLFEAQARSIE